MTNAIGIQAFQGFPPPLRTVLPVTCAVHVAALVALFQPSPPVDTHDHGSVEFTNEIRRRDRSDC